MNMPQELYRLSRLSRKTLKRGLLIGVTVGVLLLGTVLFFKYLWEPILPFLLGLLLAVGLQKPLDILDRICGRRRRIRCLWAFVLVFGCAGLCFALLTFALNALFGEFGTFFGWIADNIGAIGEGVTQITEKLESFLFSLPFAGNTEQGILFSVLSSADDMLVDLIGKTVSAVTTRLTAILTAVAAAFPRILLFIGVFLPAAVYLTIEYREIGAFFTRTFPRKTAAVLRGVRSSLVSTVLLYGRAYLILCSLTFIELYFGFHLLHIDWAFGAALLGALIDLLPVLGTGTLLLPWSVLELIRGEIFRGVGLIVLYILICIVRQTAEPRIIGKSIGLHPLAALFCMYSGVKLFGLPGLFVVPMAASVVWKYYMESRHTSPCRTQ